MIDAVRAFVDRGGVDVVLLAGVVVATLAIVTTVYSSIFAIRAKRRAMYAIRKARLGDAQLRLLLATMDKQDHLNAVQVDELRIVIREHLKSLSQQDRKYVDAGLNQNSVRGFERFVGEIAGHEHAV